MENDPTNTSENKLGGGITDKQVLDAVRNSGYPLQTVIASSLQIDFSVQEEWGFIDENVGALRTLDIWASRRLTDWSNGAQPFVRTTLDLLIECKQSELPFIFFISATRPRLRNFPHFSGLAHDVVVVKTDDDRSTWSIPILSALGLDEHPFIAASVESSMSFSKCVRKGKDLELSGTDAYQNIILPLVKALRYFKKQEQPPATARYFDCHIPLAVAVVDAPMVAARMLNNTNSLTLTPWVRVARHEAVESDQRLDRAQSFGVDVVHKSFFDKYLQQHAIPFAQQLAPLAIKHESELATGKGFASGMGANRFSNIEGRLRPR